MYLSDAKKITLGTLIIYMFSIFLLRLYKDFSFKINCLIETKGDQLLYSYHIGCASLGNVPN